MTFLASNIITSKGYDKAKLEALSIKGYAQDVQNLLLANIDSSVIINIVSVLSQKKAKLETYKNITGILQYSKDQEEDQTYDIAAEYTALVARIDDVINWVKASYPADTNGYLLVRKWTLDGTSTREFTPAQTASLSPVLQLLIDQIA